MILKLKVQEIGASGLKLLRSGTAVLASLLVLTLAGSADAQTLKEALQKAQRSNPTIQASKAGTRATRESITQQKAAWKPKVDFSASKGFNWRNTNVTPYSASIPYTLNIRLSKPLYDGGRNRQLVKQAEANFGAARQLSLATEQNTLLSVVNAYMNVVANRKILAQRRANVSVLQELARGTKKRFDVGEVTKTDVSQANARVSGAKSAVADAQARVLASEATYEQLVGNRPSGLQWPKAAHVPASLATALATAQKVNPNILAAAFTEDASRHNKRAVAAENDWQVALSASAEAEFSFELQPERDRAFSQSAQVQIQASKSLYDGGSNKSRVRQAGQLASQSRIEKIGAVRTVREGVKTAWSNYVATALAISAAQEQVNATEQALSGVRTEYTVGSRSTLDVLNTQQELITAKVTLIGAQRDRVIASYQLLAAMGKLTTRALGL
jgi:outer membrane protein